MGTDPIGFPFLLPSLLERVGELYITVAIGGAKLEAKGKVNAIGGRATKWGEGHSHGATQTTSCTGRSQQQQRRVELNLRTRTESSHL